MNYIISENDHNQLISSAFQNRGFNLEESNAAAEIAAVATTHGNSTHNSLKALHLDELLGSARGNCVPGASIVKLPNRFAAIEERFSF